MTPITPFLWLPAKAEEAARFYVGIFPDSRIERVARMPSESPSGPPESVVVVDMVLRGQPFAIMQAATTETFNNTVSFVVGCDTQDEVDRTWDALLQGGGQPQACGWLCDRYGVRWQVTPTMLTRLLGDPDRRRARQATDAMLQMVKLDIAALQAAYDA